MDGATGGKDGSESVEVTEGALRALEKTRGWVQFLGIVSVIGACLFALMLLVGLATMAAAGVAGALMVIEGAILVIVAILYAVYWLRYSGALKRLSTTEDDMNAALEEVFARQRRLWTFQGVLFIVVIVLAILAAILVPLLVNYHALPMTAA